MNFSNYLCLNCGRKKMEPFYKVENVPVHSVLIFKDKKEALEYPRADIILAFCHNCGFISNIVFNPNFQEYSSRYEGTQAFSPTFNSFHKQLAWRLIDRYNLHGKNIIEIGCGQGEFLKLICLLGNNRGVGFDPSYRGKNKINLNGSQIIFIKDFYSKKFDDLQADFIICKMTLEHIHETADFVRMIRETIGIDRITFAFFQVPDADRILSEIAFWDIYYEHCSYFSKSSLTYLFERCGFDIIDIWKNFDSQYLMLEVKPSMEEMKPSLFKKKDIKNLKELVFYFSQNYRLRLKAWQKKMKKIKNAGKRIVIWGGGSKSVAFLTTLKIKEEVDGVVDINPHKQGTFLPGTGHEILSPISLKKIKPDIVIVMNPVYCSEIHEEMQKLNISSQVISVLDL